MIVLPVKVVCNSPANDTGHSHVQPHDLWPTPIPHISQEQSPSMQTEKHCRVQISTQPWLDGLQKTYTQNIPGRRARKSQRISESQVSRWSAHALNNAQLAASEIARTSHKQDRLLNPHGAGKMAEIILLNISYNFHSSDCCTWVGDRLLQIDRELSSRTLRHVVLTLLDTS
jgi:hypothetical protein